MLPMGQYGKAAVLATAFCTQRKGLCPDDAWDLAIAKISDSDESRKKICPKHAYLGLCEAGLVTGIPKGQYSATKNNVNGRYALDAHKALKSDPTLVNDRKRLWDRIEEPRAKNENSQLDVVITMWSKGLLQR